jgi:putative ABC transport system permease protein
MSILQDLRYALRVQAKSPGFTLIAVLALALGIGANTAIFTVVSALLLRDLPYENSDRLVMVFEKYRPRNRDKNVISPANFQDWKAQNRVFERMAIFNELRLGVIVASGDPEELPAQSVGRGFFETLGVQPLIGHTFSDEEYKFGGPQFAVLSHKLWVRRFGSSPDIVGQTMMVNGTRAAITGVMPASFRTTNRAAELWVPMRFEPGRDYRATSGRFPQSIARLKPGVTFAQAQSDMDVIAARLEREYPAFNTGWGATVVPLHEQMVGDVRTAVLVLLAGVACVLLIACANVANLMLARAASRTREIAIRASLGAGRARVIRQLLTESVLLACCAGTLGYLLAVWGVDVLVAMSPKSLPMRDAIQPDLLVLGFNIGVSLLTGLLFGLAPAVSATRSDLVTALKNGSAAAVGAAGKRTRSFLVAAEIAITLVLLVGAGLLVRSFQTLQSVPSGFDPDQVLTVRISMPARYRDVEKGVAFYNDALRRIRQLPGVQSASAVIFLPMTGMVSGTGYWHDDRPRLPHGQDPVTQVTAVEPEFFRTMKVPLRQGRFFGPREQPKSSRVYIVNEALARKAFPEGDAIGRKIVVAMGDEVPGEIVGIVGDIRYTALTEPVQPTVYYSHTQLYFGMMHLLVRTSVPPGTLAGGVKAIVNGLDPELPVADLRPMDEVLADSIARSRFTMTLLAVFAGFALVLAAIGVYGVMAYTVSLRTQEIGVRMAVGARPADVMRLVFREGMAVVLLGLVAGLAASFGLTRLMTKLLYEVKPTDPATFAIVPFVLIASALMAIYLPARRATRVEPVRALRYE